MTWPVFGPAAIFPMMADDELNELAADIKANGLKQPLVLGECPDPETGELVTMLVDGRNRLEACTRVKVKPETVTLNGEDPTAFVLSANIHRRHMTKGQQAMAVAMVHPEPAKVKRKGSGSFSEKDLSASHLSKARTVLSHSPTLAREVLLGLGTVTLTKAYERAKEEEREATATVLDAEARLARLRKSDPDLAEFERRQRRAIREELDHENKAQTGLER